MNDLNPLSELSLRHAIARKGFAFVKSATMRELLAQSGPLSDWPSFSASWDHLALDSYMADGGRYRRRRHAVYAANTEGIITRQAHQPHYQSLDYNPLNGGIARWFEPISADIGGGPTMLTIIGFCRRLFGGLAPTTDSWQIEVHQFRIEARPGEYGQPTPEGMHRDGVDYVLVLLTSRCNIASGTTTIADIDRRPIGSFTLTTPFDAALVDDARVYHGVTPVEPLNPDVPAYRDVLVVTFRKSQYKG
jgi:hypothetical protein